MTDHPYSANAGSVGGHGWIPAGDAVPCGTIRYTCEQQPRITDLDRRMREILRIPVNAVHAPEELEMMQSNVFLLIPIEDRRRFARYLRLVDAADSPLAGEITVLRCDGTRVRLLGWTRRGENAQGEPEYHSVCMDMTERYHVRRQEEMERYRRALAEVYDKVFEFRLDTDMVQCLHCEEDSSFHAMLGMSVRIEDALNRWLTGNVAERERETLLAFFRSYCQPQAAQTDIRPPQITYRSRSSDGDIKTYEGLFIRIDDARSLYCCRVRQQADAVRDTDSADALRRENAGLKEGIRDLAMRFRDGIAGFEISPDGGVRPLYTSENAYEFFGYSREEWLALTERFTPLAQFVAYTDIPYERFVQGLRSGEAEFPYYDVSTGEERRIKVICTPERPGTTVPRFAMLYDVDRTGSGDAVDAAQAAGPVVFIRTFGYFDVFIGDRPIAFRNKKAKELLALLVDRRGGYITSEEAIGFLWEEEPANAMTLSRYRKVALRLKNTLEEYGIPQIVESVDGKRRLATERVTCDLYQYLSGEARYASLFKGSYLTNYSWGETTLGELTGDAL